MSYSLIAADIGGTNSRLALVGPNGEPLDMRIHRNDAFPTIEAMIETDLALRAAVPPVRGAVLAVAGPIDGDEVRLTNRDWHFSRPALAGHFGWDHLSVLNDFEALAYGVPSVTAGDLFTVNTGRPAPGAPVLVCGPGTGFGSAALLNIEGRAVVARGEGGMMRLGATNASEARLLAHLVRALGPVIVEHALSGSGLARMHHVLTGDRLAPEAVIAAAKAGEEAALETCHLFLRIFGRIAGDLALVFDARGGVFLTGGVSAGLASLIATSPFLEAFHEHPPYEDRMRAMPVHVVTASEPTPGLLGAAKVASYLAERIWPKS
ncbi:glucokinase [Ancylobacter sp. 6x-1]|uniref:Glucokinase n=1 Tax=Ancylobacter crimeensis TaxID=2579147 RepID=A0ABT0DEV7_9HYPH|nr:glucokinase [Ancylobacter crimeensis]MCK0198491.1 glucokinase [Ancylobacter crimeensis]